MTVSTIASFLALGLIFNSYFTSKKSLYLTFQGLGIVFLGVSYFFIKEYFAVISLSIGLGRTIVFFVYERRNKLAPIWVAILFSLATVLSYFIVDFGVLKTAKPWDILYLIALCLYAFTFRIRDVNKMRYALLAPNLLAVGYNILISAPIFTVFCYAFELTANLASICCARSEILQD